MRSFQADCLRVSVASGTPQSSPRRRPSKFTRSVFKDRPAFRLGRINDLLRWVNYRPSVIVCQRFTVIYFYYQRKHLCNVDSPVWGMDFNNVNAYTGLNKEKYERERWWGKVMFESTPVVTTSKAAYGRALIESRRLAKYGITQIVFSDPVLAQRFRALQELQESHLSRQRAPVPVSSCPQ